MKIYNRSLPKILRCVFICELTSRFEHSMGKSALEECLKIVYGIHEVRGL